MSARSSIEHCPHRCCATIDHPLTPAHKPGTGYIFERRKQAVPAGPFTFSLLKWKKGSFHTGTVRIE